MIPLKIALIAITTITIAAISPADSLILVA
jgi:hypothetical protein